MHWECHKLSFEFDLALKSFNGVSRKLKGCLKFQGCFKEDLRLFTESLKGISKKFRWCFKDVLRMFQRSFREIQGCFEKVSRVFQVRLKDVSSSFKGI